MKKYEGKNLLILAGTGPHVKVVEKAKELGLHTIVADYLQPSMASPAKLAADESWNISLLDVDSLIRKAKEASVDGVVAAWSDISQIPYAHICDALQLPCYGNIRQFELMSNKNAFKALCRQNNVDVIPEYSPDDVNEKKIVFPVVVKPADSRASKGISVCHNFDELETGIEKAKEASITESYLIEKYIGNKNSFQVNYFFIDGEAYVLRTADGYKGLVDEKLDRVALCSISPSIYTKQYFDHANNNFVQMLKSIGMKNGPVMAQGFYDDGVFRFYDPGLRFPGVDFEPVYNAVFGIDLTEMMIDFAMTGKMPSAPLSDDNAFLKGKTACILYPTIGSGVISEISGMDEIQNDECVYSLQTRYSEGDSVEWTYTTRQRLAEIVFLADDLSAAAEKIKEIQNKLVVLDENGNSMIYKPLDVNRLQK